MVGSNTIARTFAAFAINVFLVVAVGAGVVAALTPAIA